jgi:hypothetical protein
VLIEKASFVVVAVAFWPSVEQLQYCTVLRFLTAHVHVVRINDGEDGWHCKGIVNASDVPSDFGWPSTVAPFEARGTRSFIREAAVGLTTTIEGSEKLSCSRKTEQIFKTEVPMITVAEVNC